jgi:hypothetical protein
MRIFEGAVQANIASPCLQKGFHNPAAAVPAIRSSLAVAGQMNMHVNWSASLVHVFFLDPLMVVAFPVHLPDTQAIICRQSRV